MNVGCITIPARDVSASITATVHVSGMRRFNLRCAVSMWLLRVAGWVFPFGVNVEIKL